MQRSMNRNYSRGQAYAETVFFVPIFLILVYGVIWTMQLTVLGERSQVAVRYSGLISNQANPIMQYSLYTLYNSLPENVRITAPACTKPTSNALDNTGTFPGPQTAPLWYSGSLVNTVSGKCSQGRLTISANGLIEPALFIYTQSDLTTVLHAPSLFPGATNTIQASQNILRTPDVTSLMMCYPDLGATVQNSLTHAKLNEIAPPPPIPDFPPTTPLGQAC